MRHALKTALFLAKVLSQEVVLLRVSGSAVAIPEGSEAGAAEHVSEEQCMEQTGA